MFPSSIPTEAQATVDLARLFWRENLKSWNIIENPAGGKALKGTSSGREHFTALWEKKSYSLTSLIIHNSILPILYCQTSECKLPANPLFYNDPAEEISKCNRGMIGRELPVTNWLVLKPTPQYETSVWHCVGKSLR